MSNDKAVDELHRFLAENGLPCSDEIINKFNDFYDLIEEFRHRTNLIGPLSKEQIYDSLFCDSLTLFVILLQMQLTIPKRIIDVGSGAGFPGIPLAIVAMGLKKEPHFTLIEPRGKRATFLQIAVTHLGLKNITIEKARVEKMIHEKRTFDFATSKAFKPPLQWLQSASELLRKGGLATILHTEKYRPEIEDFLATDSRWKLVSKIDDVATLGLRKDGPTRSVTLVKLIA